MNAIVSASAGRAIVIDRDRLFSIEAADLTTLVPRSPRDVRFLLGERRDLVFLERVTVDDVRARLEQALRHHDALRWTLGLLDGDLKESTRSELARAAEGLLLEQGPRDFVEAVLYARPIPPDLDPEGAERIASAAACAHVALVLEELMARQSAIESVYQAWETIPTKPFGTPEDRERARAAVVREGLFRELAKALAAAKGTGAILAAALLSPALRAVPRHRDFLQRWSRHLAKPAQPRPIELDETDTEHAPVGAARSRESAPNKLVGHAAWQRVEAQQTGIRDALARRNLDAARKQMAELVIFQIQNDERAFAVKSLCKMAAHAQRRGMRTLQDEWTAEAVKLGPDDGWAWNQRGKALLDLGRAHEALAAYSHAEAFGGGAAAKNGRAEVLKAMGRFDDALRAYDDAAKLHPEDVFAKTGRAEVLKAMGRFDDALRAYDDAVKLHPKNVVAKSGRAEVLKAMGRFDDALRAYDDAAKLHPEDVVAKNGRASLLALLGKSNEALRALPQVHAGTFDYWVGEHIRGMILLRTAKLNEAIKIFERGLRDCAFSTQQTYFRHALGVAFVRKREYAAAAEVLAQLSLEQPSNINRVLQVHVLGELKQFDQAVAVSKAISPTLPEFLENLRREVDARYVQRTGASWTDDRLIAEEIKGCLLAA
jgi:tetratricopeptide (TPR) repeat protein